MLRANAWICAAPVLWPYSGLWLDGMVSIVQDFTDRAAQTAGAMTGREK